MNKRTRLYVIIGVGVVLVVLIASRFFSGGKSNTPEQRRPSAPIVNVETPKRQTVVNALEYTADVTPVQQTGVFAKVTGTLEHVYVDIGAMVTRGQLLALMDTTELSQQYQQAAATYQNAKVNYERTKELAAQNLVAKQDLDNAEATMKVSTAAYEGARTRLSYAYIRAPFTGYITRRFFDPGVVVSSSNTTLFTLMDLNAMKIMINVQEKDIPVISAGKEATVTVDAYPGKEFTGRVTRYSDALDPATRTMAVEIDIDNRNHMLKPGMFANVTLIVDQHPNALTLPTMALMKDEKGFYVYTVVQDTARPIRVTPGLEQSGRTEIRSGLSGNEPIVVAGQQLVRMNGPVMIEK